MTLPGGESVGLTVSYLRCVCCRGVSSQSRHCPISVVVEVVSSKTRQFPISIVVECLINTYNDGGGHTRKGIYELMLLMFG